MELGKMLSTTSTKPVSTQSSRKRSLRALGSNKVLELILILALAKIAMLVLVYLFPPTLATKFPIVAPTSGGFSSLIATLNNLWDAQNYVEIAHFGYPPYNVLLYPTRLYAFSPVYPVLIILSHYLTKLSYFESAFFVTNLMSFVFPLIVLKLFDFRTALLLEVFPTYLVYTTVGYSDALALIFLGLAFVCFFKRRYFFVGFALSAAGLVLYDLFLAALPFAIYLLLFQKDRRVVDYLKLLAPVLMAGTSVLAAYKITTGNPFAFISLERIFWGVNPSNPIAQVQWTLASTGVGSFLTRVYDLLGVKLTPTYWAVRNILFEAFLFCGIILLTRIKDPRKWLFVIYSAVLSAPLLFMVGYSVYSVPRLMLAAFPLFAGYSMILRSKRQLGIYVAICAVVSFWAILSFVYAFFA